MLVASLVFSSTVTSLAAVPKLTDLTSQFTSNDLERKQLTQPVKLTSDQVNLTYSDRTRDALPNLEIKGINYKTALVNVGLIGEYSDTFLKDTFEKSIKDSKANRSSFIGDSPLTGGEDNTEVFLILTLTNNQDQVIAYYPYQTLNGKAVEYTPKNEVKYDYPNLGMTYIDTYRMGYGLDENFIEKTSGERFLCAIYSKKILEKYPDFVNVTVSSFNKLPSSKNELELDKLIAFSSENRIGEHFIFGFECGNSVSGNTESYLIIKYISKDKKVLGYTELFFKDNKFVNNSLDTVMSEALKTNITKAKTQFTQFKTDALVLSENKAKQTVLKINRTKLPKEMQKFTKYTLNATSTKEFYGINKSFTTEGIAKSVKYNYKDEIGLLIQPNGTRIFCMQLFDNNNKLLGYVVFE